MSDLETDAVSANSRKAQAKELVGQAGDAIKAEAQSFASAAQQRVKAEAQRGTQVGAKTLGDFANAVRRAGDELAGSDQSPASHLVQQAADGLESLSRNLADKDPGDLLNAVRDFGRRNPAAFIGGAVLVGLAIGRFARASEPHAETGGFRDEPQPFVPPVYATPTEAPADLGVADTVSPIGLSAGEPIEDGTSGIGEPDATGSPYVGGR